MGTSYLGKNAVRNWTLYAIKFTDNTYYIGITSYRNFMRRINEHGGLRGAKCNLHKTLQEIVEVQCLGKMKHLKAQNIENDVYLDYRKEYGQASVSGGYNTSKNRSIIPNYTPGSWQWLVIVSGCVITATSGLILFLYAKSQLRLHLPLKQLLGVMLIIFVLFYADNTKPTFK